MRALIKFVTMLTMSLVNWVAFVTLARQPDNGWIALFFLVMGVINSKTLFDLALERFMETSTKTGLDEKPVTGLVNTSGLPILRDGMVELDFVNEDASWNSYRALFRKDGKLAAFAEVNFDPEMRKLTFPKKGLYKWYNDFNEDNCKYDLTVEFKNRLTNQTTYEFHVPILFDLLVIGATLVGAPKIEDVAGSELVERYFWDMNANGGHGKEYTDLVPQHKLLPQMKITPDIEEAMIKAAQQSLDNMGIPVWDNVRLRKTRQGDWVDFCYGNHLALSIPKESLEAILNAPRKLSMNVVADPTLPPGTARMVNTETGEVLGTITNIKLEDK